MLDGHWIENCLTNPYTDGCWQKQYDLLVARDALAPKIRVGNERVHHHDLLPRTLQVTAISWEALQVENASSISMTEWLHTWRVPIVIQCANQTESKTIFFKINISVLIQWLHTKAKTSKYFTASGFLSCIASWKCLVFSMYSSLSFMTREGILSTQIEDFNLISFETTATREAISFSICD